MGQESYDLIRHKYEAGAYNLKQMVELVDKRWITEKQFHYITTYSYKALKKSRGW